MYYLYHSHIDYAIIRFMIILLAVLPYTYAIIIIIIIIIIRSSSSSSSSSSRSSSTIVIIIEACLG